MLVRCQECSQVIEVSALTEHLLRDCDKHENFTLCTRCTEAIKVEEYEKHIKRCPGIKTVII